MSKTVLSVRISDRTKTELDGLSEHYAKRFAFNAPTSKTDIVRLAIKRLAKAELTGEDAYKQPPRAFDAAE